MYDIITFGSATRDAFFYSKNFQVFENENFPSKKALCFNLGSKIEIDKVVFTTGGGATNTACAFSRFGLKTAIVCQVGNDVSGRAVLEDLKKDKVKTDFVLINEVLNTAYSVILSLGGKERTILVYRGASENLNFHEIPWKKLKAKWFYLTSCGGDFLFLSEIFSFAKKNKIKIAFNPGSKELARPYDLLPLLKEVAILLVNEEEGEKLTGIPQEEPKKMLEKLKSDGFAGSAIITCGPKGAFALFKNEIYQAGSLFTQVVERTGAGDAFGAGFVTGMILKNDIIFALQLATANATSVVQQIGAKAGLLTKNDLENFKKVEVKKV